MILDVNEDNYKEVYDFLKAVPTINAIDEKILYNASFIKEDNILGMISFEKFNKYGLIRYFVFKKNVSLSGIYGLIEEISKKVKKYSIDKLILIATNSDMKNMLEGFDFIEYNKKHFFIEEKNISNTRYKDTFIMVRNL